MMADLTRTAGNQLDLSILKGETLLLSTPNTWMTITRDKPSPSKGQLRKRANKEWRSPDEVLVEPLVVWKQHAYEHQIQIAACHYTQQIFIRIHQRYFGRATGRVETACS